MHIAELIDYQIWSDNKTIGFLSELSEEELTRTFQGYTSIKERADHIVMALAVWYSRIKGKSPSSLPSFLNKPTDEILDLWKAYDEKLQHIDIHSGDSFTYHNSSGIEFENEMEDVLFHLINHTTFYRSQIIMMIRLLGYEVENTDYIYFLREKEDNVD